MSLPPEQAAEAPFNVGDILAAAVGATFGKTYLHASDIGPAAFAGYLVRISPGADFEPRFVAYWSESHHYWDQVNTSVVQSTIQNFSAAKYAELRLPAPPLETQCIIANYLDRETARLDALVAAKERVLGLLAEKRRAVITRAVTRGLDPRARLRDSGIPWLGEIPAHWEAWKLGHVAFVGNGSTPNRDNPEYWTEGVIPWLNSSVVNQDEVTASDQFVTPTAFRECHLPLVKPGSVLIGITGQGKTRGSAVVLSFEATINQHLAFITPNANLLNAWFLRWALFAAYEFLRSISDDAGGTKGALTCEAVAALYVPLPPLNDQRAIVAHVSSEASKLDALRVATERTIALIKERRAALIAAAVTGRHAPDFARGSA
ncbi:MAG: restriction endonuclease subunit S [Gammaproteobacteria bacterium]|nr:MAG: restriction endonuclease subunit S [Gammaproteobacteria bacterium]